MNKCNICGGEDCDHVFKIDREIRFMGAGIFEIPEGVEWDCKFIKEEEDDNEHKD